MNRIEQFQPEFVDSFPSPLAPGVLYVSIPFASVAHSCACGCGREVITPLTPTDWKMIYDGETVSLDPSIGSWSFPCRSHYFIRRDRVMWAGDFDDETVQRVRASDKLAKAVHYGLKGTTAKPVGDGQAPRKGWMARLFAWFT